MTPWSFCFFAHKIPPCMGLSMSKVKFLDVWFALHPCSLDMSYSTSLLYDLWFLLVSFRHDFNKALV